MPKLKSKNKKKSSKKDIEGSYKFTRIQCNFSFLSLNSNYNFESLNKDMKAEWIY